MKKILALLLILCFALPSQAAFWNRKDKALEAELQGKGYVGTLPDLNKNMQTKEPRSAKPVFESQKSFDDPAALKPVPKDNPAFVDIITRQDKTSNYVKFLYFHNSYFFPPQVQLIIFLFLLIH